MSLGRRERVRRMWNRHGGHVGGSDHGVRWSRWPGERGRLLVPDHFIHLLSLDLTQPVLCSQSHELLRKVVNRFPRQIPVCELLQEKIVRLALGKKKNK